MEDVEGRIMTSWPRKHGGGRRDPSRLLQCHEGLETARAIERRGRERREEEGEGEGGEDGER